MKGLTKTLQLSVVKRGKRNTKKNTFKERTYKNLTIIRGETGKTKH
ncbi:MAG: hypothetical protein FWE74_04475 [Oscillospiraceae bacterium]|nr:hypothetical protein [Oscillospiraceae bacterium]